MLDKLIHFQVQIMKDKEECHKKLQEIEESGVVTNDDLDACIDCFLGVRKQLNNLEEMIGGCKPLTESKHDCDIAIFKINQMKVGGKTDE